MLNYTVNMSYLTGTLYESLSRPCQGGPSTTWWQEKGFCEISDIISSEALTLKSLLVSKRKY